MIPILKTALAKLLSLNHLFDSESAGLCILKPVSSLATKKPKSYLRPRPLARASSFKSSKPLNLSDSSFTLSSAFQIFPPSINSAPLKAPKIGKRYSRLKASLKFASLNSNRLPLDPGPRS